MELKISKGMAEVIGLTPLAPFGVTASTFSYAEAMTIDLSETSEEDVEALRAILAAVTPPNRGVTLLIKDIDAWREVIGGSSAVKARTVRQFCAMLTEILRRVPGHRVYNRSEEEHSLGYYVSEVKYVERDRNDAPEHVRVSLSYRLLGRTRTEALSFHARDCAGMTPLEALARRGYTVETEELRAGCLADEKSFIGLTKKIGLQCWADGIGHDDLDGKNHWTSETIKMPREGVRARVVIDIVHEGEKDKRRESTSVDSSFWTESTEEGNDRPKLQISSSGRVASKAKKTKDVDLDEEVIAPLEIPLHPFVACFDLRRFARLRIHVRNLEPYTYDLSMSERLVLPADVKDLVSMLISDKSGFQDIVRDKSGGAIVLCVGPSGVGKTLTAEVYAETKQRPLYSVQASQLGITAESLEEQLGLAFERATRWDAILLIDEADVYVKARGDDLEQNAIVGVLLRMLEYYPGILFFTTNRGSIIDDAIASRCMARIDYTLPCPEDLAKIWRIISDVAGVQISAETITAVVAQHPGISGRDVKNLIKLSRLVAASKGGEITPELVSFVKRFKPTKDEAPTPAEVSPAAGLTAGLTAARRLDLILSMHNSIQNLRRRAFFSAGADVADPTPLDCPAARARRYDLAVAAEVHLSQGLPVSPDRIWDSGNQDL